MRRIIFGAIWATALCHCSAPTPAANTLVAPLTQAAVTKAPLTQAAVAGDWDIVSFDGYRPARLDNDGQRHAFLNLRGNKFSFAIECNYSGMNARIDSGRLAAITSDNVQTQMACGPERARREAAFFSFLRGGPSSALLGGHDLALEKDGTRLVLQRPEVRRRALLPAHFSELEGAWRADILYWRVAPGRTDNLLADLSGAPARFTFARAHVDLSVDCETLSAPAELAEPGKIVVRSNVAARTRGHTCSLSDANRDKALSLLSGAVTAENMPSNRLYLESGDVYAVLQRE